MGTTVRIKHKDHPQPSTELCPHPWHKLRHPTFEVTDLSDQIQWLSCPRLWRPQLPASQDPRRRSQFQKAPESAQQGSVTRRPPWTVKGRAAGSGGLSFTGHGTASQAGWRVRQRLPLGSGLCAPKLSSGEETGTMIQNFCYSWLRREEGGREPRPGQPSSGSKCNIITLGWARPVLLV